MARPWARAHPGPAPRGRARPASASKPATLRHSLRDAEQEEGGPPGASVWDRCGGRDCSCRSGEPRGPRHMGPGKARAAPQCADAGGPRTDTHACHDGGPQGTERGEPAPQSVGSTAHTREVGHSSRHRSLGTPGCQHRPGELREPPAPSPVLPTAHNSRGRSGLRAALHPEAGGPLTGSLGAPRPQAEGGGRGRGVEERGNGHVGQAVETGPGVQRGGMVTRESSGGRTVLPRCMGEGLG